MQWLVKAIGSWIGKSHVNGIASAIEGGLSAARVVANRWAGKASSEIKKVVELGRTRGQALFDHAAKIKVDKKNLIRAFNLSSYGFTAYAVYDLFDSSGVGQENAKRLGLAVVDSENFKALYESIKLEVQKDHTTDEIDAGITALYAGVKDSTPEIGTVLSTLESKTSKLGALIAVSLIDPTNLGLAVANLRNSGALTDEAFAVYAQIAGVVGTFDELFISDGGYHKEWGERLLPAIDTVAAIKDLERILGLTGCDRHGEPRLAKLLQLLSRVSEEDVRRYYEVRHVIGVY